MRKREIMFTTFTPTMIRVVNYSQEHMLLVYQGLPVFDDDEREKEYRLKSSDP